VCTIIYFFTMKGIHTEVARQEGLIRFNCHGTASLEGYREVADRIRAEMAGEARGTKVFVDIVGVAGELEDMDQFSMGEYIAKTLSSYRIAVLMRQEAITRFGENTAVNRGADIRVGSDEAELLNWLKVVQILR
jgi:hypothetical protein